MKIDKWFHLYGRKDDIVFEEVPFEELPSTERRGKWIAKSGAKDLWYCSECGNTIYSEHEHDRQKFHAWCGQCGARMVEDDRQS